jgi:hypothetical protein
VSGQILFFEAIRIRLEIKIIFKESERREKREDYLPFDQQA